MTITLNDLQPFCSTDDFRPHLNRPFNSGGYTYATNGHILVRIPAIEGVAGCESLDVNDIVHQHFTTDLKFATARMKTMAVSRLAHNEKCDACDGTGIEHECPNCHCKCPECDGTGTMPGKWPIVKIDRFCFQGNYVKLMQSFGEVSISPAQSPRNPLSFYFEGGEGLLLPYRSETHELEAELESTP